MLRDRSCVAEGGIQIWKAKLIPQGERVVLVQRCSTESLNADVRNREIAVLAAQRRYRHPHLASTLAAYLVGSELWWVYDLSEGVLTEILEAWPEPSCRLSTALLAYVLRATCSALAFLRRLSVTNVDLRSDEVQNRVKSRELLLG